MVLCKRGARSARMCRRGASGVLVLVLVVVTSRGQELVTSHLQPPSVLEALPPGLLPHLEDLLRLATSACEILPLEALGAGVAGPGWEPPGVVEVRRGGRRVLRAGAVPRPGRGELPLYVPGWWNTPDDAAARALLPALLARHDTVLVLDTRRAFGRGYLAAAAALDAVARHLAALLERLAGAGVPPAALHLVGFSLGAHAAGAAARLLRGRTGARVGRITALDPARPCFSRPGRRLRRSDARFVHVLHSSALGLAAPLGHVDVYVARRAECGARRAALQCDHEAAWRVFAGSVAAPLAARRCAGWAELRAGACAGAAASVGYDVNTTLRGVFLSESPPDA